MMIMPTKPTPFLLMLIVVATAAVHHNGNAAAAGSTTTVAGGVRRHRSSSSSSSSSFFSTNNRQLNFLEDMWNDVMGGGGIGGKPGSGAVSGEFVPGMYDNNNNGNFDFGGGGMGGGGGDIADGVNWGQDGAWDDWLTSFMNDGGLEDVLNGVNGVGGGDGVGGGLDFGDLDMGGIIDTLGGMDFGDMDFGAGAGGIMDSLGGIFGGGGGDFEVCSIIEMAIGMSPQFGVRANCNCLGDLQSGFDIDCTFEQCAVAGTGGGGGIGGSPSEEEDANNDEGVCGTVNLDFDFGGPDGIINATACADLADDGWEETCFSYEIDMRNTNGVGGGGGDEASQTSSCEASYGGNPCACTIDDNLCLSIDCTPFLEGGTMDTCQILSMIDADDVTNWFPSFEAFLPGFTDGSSNNNGLPALDGLLPGGGSSGNDRNEDSEDDNEDNNSRDRFPESDWNEDSEEDNNNNAEDELEDEEVPVDITIPSRPLEPIGGDIVVLQASELVNSGSSRSTTGINLAATGFVFIAVAILL